MSSQLQKVTKTVKLNSGKDIPAVGLGTWQSLENEAYKAVLEALKAGYRHIDGAAIYKNEEEVGRAIRDSGVPREEIFLTTKLWGTQHRHPEKALDDSLKRLGLDYVDLYLMHWPVALKVGSIKDGNYLMIPHKADGSRDLDIEDWNFIKTWELMQELPKTGKVRSIGVSNFSINNLKDLLASPENKIVPAVNQIELHPLLPQFDVVDFCHQKNIAVEAYSPLGGKGASILNEPVVEAIARKHDVPPANVIISWGVQRDLIILPKSVTPSRIVSNFKILELDEDDMKKIGNISKEKGEKRMIVPDWAPFKPFV